jgi:glutathione S-transferase
MTGESSASALKLHYFPESGNSYKVALMLTLCGVPWQPVYVDFFDSVTRSAQWRSTMNEMGEVPVLEHAGRKLTQSGVILTYLAAWLRRFGGRDEEEEREILRWLFFDNHKFTSYFVTHRFLRSFTPTAPDPAVLAFLRGRIDACFAVAEAHLQHRQFMVADQPSIADFSMVGYLYFPASETGYDLPSSHPNIARWLERIAALPGWRPPYDLLPGKRFAHRLANPVRVRESDFES